MFAYDSASSSSSSSSPPLRHPFRRKPSPSSSPRHVSQHSPPSPRPYSPSSRQADIARILDPAYASPAYHSPLSRSSKMQLRAVYVDHHGDLHDPDFRDFPPFSPSHIHPRRPQWERAYQGDDDDSEECEPEQRRPSFDLLPRKPSSAFTYQPPPVYHPYEEPASYESRYLAGDDDEEVDRFERTPLKEKSFCTRRPKNKDDKPSPTSVGDQVIEGDSEWTPTCTQNLRRRWQAFTLSLRFSLFRTKRRIKRRLTG